MGHYLVKTRRLRRRFGFLIAGRLRWASPWAGGSLKSARRAALVALLAAHPGTFAEEIWIETRHDFRDKP